MFRYILRYYLLPAIFQFLLMVIFVPVFFELRFLPAELVTQFIPWLLVFTVGRTFASVFIENDWLSTLTGFLAADFFVYVEIKTMRWPGKEIMVISAIAGVIFALLLWSRSKRFEQKR